MTSSARQDGLRSLLSPPPQLLCHLDAALDDPVDDTINLPLDSFNRFTTYPEDRGIWFLECDWHWILRFGASAPEEKFGYRVKRPALSQRSRAHALGGTMNKRNVSCLIKIRDESRGAFLVVGAAVLFLRRRLGRRESCLVRRRSSREGVGSPDGWL